VSADFYADAAELVKVLAALLFLFDVETHAELRAMETVPRSLQRLRADTERLEVRRLEILRALDTFRLLSGTAATRGAVFLRAAETTFGVDALRTRVEDKLRETEFVLSSRYSVSLQRGLQTYALLLAVITVILSGVGVFAALRP
jgi:hypothetical protein